MVIHCTEHYTVSKELIQSILPEVIGLVYIEFNIVLGLELSSLSIRDHVIQIEVILDVELYDLISHLLGEVLIQYSLAILCEDHFTGYISLHLLLLIVRILHQGPLIGLKLQAKMSIAFA